MILFVHSRQESQDSRKMKNRPIKIMYLIDYLYGTTGGTERQVFELINNLDREICEPYLTVFRFMPYLRAHGFPCDIKVLNIHKLAAPSTFFRLLVFSRFIQRNNIDLVHIFFNDASVATPLFCRIGGAKVISSRRDMGFWYTPGKLAALRLSNLFLDKIVANCNAVRENVYRMEHFPLNRIQVIYNGHDEKRFQQPPFEQLRNELNIGERDPIIGMVSNLYEIKRPHDLLTAFKSILVHHPAAHVVFVGGGELEITRMTKVANDLGVEDKVRFIGRIEDPVPIIKHFDVCVLCSETEGLSNAIIEYMGCGKATVCTDAGGNGELIQDGFNGYVVPVGDTQAMAERIITLIANPELKKTYEANARAIFSQGLFYVKAMVDAHMKLYMEEIKAG